MTMRHQLPPVAAQYVAALSHTTSAKCDISSADSTRGSTSITSTHRRSHPGHADQFMQIAVGP